MFRYFFYNHIAISDIFNMISYRRYSSITEKGQRTSIEENLQIEINLKHEAQFNLLLLYQEITLNFKNTVQLLNPFLTIREPALENLSIKIWHPIQRYRSGPRTSMFESATGYITKKIFFGNQYVLNINHVVLNHPGGSL